MSGRGRKSRRSSVFTSLVELVVKSCVELLRLSGINIHVVFRHPFVLIRQQTTYHFKTSNSQHWEPVRESGIQGTVCLSTVNQKRITTWKEVLPCESEL